MLPCGFNLLAPALILQVRIFALYPIGTLPDGRTWSDGNSVGTLKSVPGSDLEINATALHMNDLFFIGAEQGPYELNARGAVKTDDGHFITVQGNGLVENSPHVQAILTNKTDVKPTAWGEITTSTTWGFKASGKYSALASSLYVANIRLSPSDGEETKAYVEFQLSKVLAGPLCDQADGGIPPAKVRASPWEL